MKNNRTPALKVAQGAIIAALYVVLTVIFAPISFGEMQVRISEALTILPMFTPAAIPGLFVGCVLGNLLGGAIPVDVIFGSLATLIGAVGGYLLRKNRWLVPLPTVLSNAVIVPFVLRYGYGVTLPIPLMMVYVAVGEIISCYVLGELLCTVLLRHPAQEHLRAEGREEGSITVFSAGGYKDERAEDQRTVPAGLPRGLSGADRSGA